MIKKIYDKVIFSHTKMMVGLFVFLFFIFGYYASKVEIDASAETLLVDNDKDLAFAREVNRNFANPNYLIMTFSPKQSLLSKESIDTIKSISSDLKKVPNIQSVMSILNIPLLQSPIVPLSNLIEKVDTLETKSDPNMAMVKHELLTSPLYKDIFVSQDFKTTAIVIEIKNDDRFDALLTKRNKLFNKKREGTLTVSEEKEISNVIEEFKKYRDKEREATHNQIKQIRAIVAKYQSKGDMFIGGVTMISNDIIGFVQSDLKSYGVLLIVMLMVVLWFVFGKLRWVVISIAVSLFSIVATAGVLGIFGFEVTVVSSNFIAIQLITTMSIIIYLVVRYREIHLKYPKSTQYKLVINTVLSKLNPSFFSVVTTIAGFSSLVLSKIEPVVNFGYMMSVGIFISLVIIFILFPLIVLMVGKSSETINSNHAIEKVMNFISGYVKNHLRLIFVVSVLTVGFAISGALKIIVENSFINYFKSDTEIYKGMKVIDEKLGGTTPLDIIIQFKEDGTIRSATAKSTLNEDDFSDFEDEFANQADDPKYWFSQDKVETITAVHHYLETIPQIGKVQSLASLLELGKILNNGKKIDDIMLALLYTKMPKKEYQAVMSPFVNIEKNQARISTRIVDSNPNLRRDALIQKINQDLSKIIKNKETTYQTSGLMVLYNNMLQSLFESQILTLGTALGIVFVMFVISFRTINDSLIALVANSVPISTLFGIMGWFDIPIDVMTITIASISIGIGVDQSIHFIHRYKVEFAKDNSYIEAMKRTHRSVAFAMSFTSFAIMLGFSVLIFSNLVPTVLFGFLTVVVIFAVWVSSIMLLPALIIAFKPYSKN